MSKLTRKSSSGMFSLPTFKRDKSRLLSAAEQAANEGDEEGDLSASASSLKERDGAGGSEKGNVGSGTGSAGGSRNSRSWSTALKLGKKKSEAPPSVSGLSITSGADEEEGTSREKE